MVKSAKTIQEAAKEIEALGEIMVGDDQVDNILEGVDPDSYIMEEAGSFDSPGYDMHAYVIAWVEDDKPKVVTWVEESY